MASSIGLAMNTTPPRSAATTERTWRSAGVTGSPSTSSRRAPSRSAQLTSCAVRPQPRCAGDELDPPIVVVGEAHLGRPAVDVDVEDLERLLRTRLGRDDQTGRRPVHLGEVREADPIPLDVHDVSVEPDQVQRHLGVVGPGERVGDLSAAASPAAPDRRSTPRRSARCRPASRRSSIRPDSTSSPRWRRISSAAMKSALPHVTVSGSSSPPAITRHDPSSSATRSVRSLT